MNNWTRQTMLEDNFNDMHSIKPEVYYLRINNNEYKIKLVYNNKEIVLKEILDRGLPKEVTLEYNSEILPFNRMYDAEKKAVEMFKE